MVDIQPDFVDLRGDRVVMPANAARPILPVVPVLHVVPMDVPVGPSVHVVPVVGVDDGASCDDSDVDIDY